MHFMKTYRQSHSKRQMRGLALLLIGILLGSSGLIAQQQPAAGQANRAADPNVDLQTRVGPSPGIAPVGDYDAALAEAVKSRLIHDKNIPSHLIEVAAEEGIVTLSGRVQTLLAKERALTHAQLVSGVREIRDDITIETPEVDDDKIRGEVMMALAKNPATDAIEMKAEVRNGNVILTGTAESWAERQLAEQIAKGIKGVRNVENGVSIEVPSNRADRDIANDVRQRLESDVVMQQSAVSAEVNNGKVTLSGRVPNLYQKERAFADAWVEGVRSVDISGLTVDPGLIAAGRAASEPAESGTAAGSSRRASDAQIRQSLIEALVADPYVSRATPQVEVQNGVVTLTGRVNTFRTSRAAERIASRTAGVQEVRNLIAVKPQAESNDQKLVEEIKSGIERDPYLEPFQIDVKAEKGVVTLTGQVDSTFERLEAEAVAAESPGVVDVKNRLTVRRDRVGYQTWPFVAHDKPTEEIPAALAPGETPPAGRVTERDRALLEEVLLQLSTNPALKGKEIRATIANGVVTLTGTVGTPAERKHASEEAFEAGAVEVVNRIEVRGTQ